MKRITAIILSVCLCLIAAGCGGAPEAGAGSGGTGMNTEQGAEHASGAGQNTEQGAESGGTTRDAGAEAWRTEDFVGDWSGNVLLSVNSDNTWAAKIHSLWLIGTWEADDRENRINLNVQNDEDYTEGACYFEKSPKGCRLHIPDTGADPPDQVEYYLSKMENEPPETLYGTWRGRVELSEYNVSYVVHLSIDADRIWSSVVSEEGTYIEADLEGGGFAGEIRYVSESGHLMVFDEGRGGITRKSPSVIRYVASASLDHWGRIPLHFDLEKFMVPGTIN